MMTRLINRECMDHLTINRTGARVAVLHAALLRGTNAAAGACGPISGPPLRIGARAPEMRVEAQRTMRVSVVDCATQTGLLASGVDLDVPGHSPQQLGRWSLQLNGDLVNDVSIR